MNPLSNPSTQASLLSLPPSRTNITAIRHPFHTARLQPRQHCPLNLSTAPRHPLNPSRNPVRHPFHTTCYTLPTYIRVPTLRVQIHHSTQSVTSSTPLTTRCPPTAAPHSPRPNPPFNPIRHPFHATHHSLSPYSRAPILLVQIHHSTQFVTHSVLPHAAALQPRTTPLVQICHAPSSSAFPSHTSLTNRL